MQSIRKKTALWSRISILLASLCVVHCLATPFLLLLLPALSTFFSETLEQVLVLSVLPISLLGFIPTWLRHKDNKLMGVYVLSITLILFSQFFLHVDHDHLAGDSITAFAWARTGVTFTGALLLAWTVYKNNRHTHYCTHPHHLKETARPRPDPQNKNIPIH